MRLDCGILLCTVEHFIIGRISREAMYRIPLVVNENGQRSLYQCRKGNLAERHDSQSYRCNAKRFL